MRKIFHFTADALEGSSIKDEENFSLYGRCIGGKFHPEKHSSGIIIKAVTYNMMEIKRENGVWRARVVLDV